jgi:hypothetical protein
MRRRLPKGLPQRISASQRSRRSPSVMPRYGENRVSNSSTTCSAIDGYAMNAAPSTPSRRPCRPAAAATAVTTLTESLALWRGPAGQGLPTGTVLNIDLNSLDEQRLAVFDTLVDAQLRLDQYAALIPVLRKHL